MQLSPVVIKLRAANTRFSNRIVGAAELDLALKYTLKKETAFVIQLSEQASPNTLDNGVSQSLVERFAVVVALANDSSQSEKTGLVAYDSLDACRAEIWHAILGWDIEGFETPISYAGGRLIAMNSAYLWYQFEFLITREVNQLTGHEDGIQINRDDLPNFDTVYAQYVFAQNNNLPVEEGQIPVTFDPDMTQIIDLTPQPELIYFKAGEGQANIGLTYYSF